MHNHIVCQRSEYITVSKDVVVDILNKLNNKFGKESPLKTCRGKVIEYLGMKIDY